MANEDVLKRAAEYVDNPGTWALKGGNTIRLVNDLAAALREARGDRERLERAIRSIRRVHTRDASNPNFCGGCTDTWPCRTQAPLEVLDAAMKPPGGEGSGHE